MILPVLATDIACTWKAFHFELRKSHGILEIFLSYGILEISHRTEIPANFPSHGILEIFYCLKVKNIFTICFFTHCFFMHYYM